MSFSLIKAISKAKDNVLIPNLKFMVPKDNIPPPPPRKVSKYLYL